MKRILQIFCLSFILIIAACAPKPAVDSDPTEGAGTDEPVATATQNATEPAPVMPGDVKPITSAAEADAAEKLAASGDPAANASLALYYYNGGEPIDVEKAAIRAKTAAEAGVVEGKYVLAELLLYQRDDRAVETGLHMAQEASEAGYLPAVAALGKYYFMGRAVPRDHSKARELFEKAAAQNDPGGQYNLGMMYATGAGGLPQDPAKAAEYFKKAAAQGFSMAQFALATQYAKGEGVPQNIDEAIRLYQGPANAGNVRAQVNLATILLESEKNPSEGVAWLRKAAAQNSPLAKFFLADCLLSGRGVTKNEAEGFKYCKQAAESGLPIAQGLLGELYFQGVGTGRDLQQAAHWYTQAAAWGDTVAMFRLAGMYYEGLGVKQDINESYYWAVLAEATEPVEETRGMRTGIGQQLSEQQRKAVERRAQNWKPKTMPL